MSQPLDLEAIRAKLAAGRGKQYWRSLEELAETPEFTDFLHREFPREASILNYVDRRSFLKIMGASLALLGLNSCDRNTTYEKVIPNVNQSPEQVAGIPLYFATAITLGGIANGVLARSDMGRCTKIEGNPNHPASLGATDIFSQASVLTLWDPERSQYPVENGEPSSWSRFLNTFQSALDAQATKGGEGLAILTSAMTSPTTGDVMKHVLEKFPKARWFQWEPAHCGMARAGAMQVFGENVNPIYHFDKADVILSLGSDFLCAEPGNVRYAREFASRRKVGDGQALSRVYAVESTPTLVGSMADHRLPLRSSQIEAFTREVAKRLGLKVEQQGSVSGVPDVWIEALVEDLQRHAGSSIVVPGAEQAPALHALAHLINQKLGNFGKTVTFTRPIQSNPTDYLESLRTLTNELNAKKVELLVILDNNPVYNAPIDFDFPKAIGKAALAVHMGLYNDATGHICRWHVPMAHELECWGDARAYDGTVTIQQPLSVPIYNGKPMLELLSCMAGEDTLTSQELVNRYWRKNMGNESDFDAAWGKALNDGVVANTQFPNYEVSIKNSPDFKSENKKEEPATLELLLRPDPTIWDGRFINNGWLQELPKPITQTTWDNAALVAPTLAEKYELANNDMVELTVNGRVLQCPVWIVPGQAPDCVTLHLGYGQEHCGRVGAGTGFNAYSLRTSSAIHGGDGLLIRKMKGTYSIACTQLHHTVAGREIILEATTEEYQHNPDFVDERLKPKPQESIYRNWEYPEYAWGMVIDISACTGCSVCTVACQAENNIPIVGKEQVELGREMHWIPVDRYQTGNIDNPEVAYQPKPCMQCENAPCELVCPVQATVHSAEGLNDMVYNRCIGTRYCSNNCPYKVRRFNFLDYGHPYSTEVRLRSNPEVTVRERGVMEKCTYCVQRINRGRIQAQVEDRKVRDGEITPACAQACPSEAIIFGDLNNPESRVAKLCSKNLNYPLLGELNTRPRTSYLARIRNPNPKIKEPDTFFPKERKI